MKSKLFLCLVIFCVIFSAATVSASDNQTEVLSDSSDFHSFSELNRQISESDGEMTLENDYKYDGKEITIVKGKNLL